MFCKSKTNSLSPSRLFTISQAIRTSSFILFTHVNEGQKSQRKGQKDTKRNFMITQRFKPKPKRTCPLWLLSKCNIPTPFHTAALANKLVKKLQISFKTELMFRYMALAQGTGLPFTH